MPTDAKMKEQLLRQERAEIEFHIGKGDFSAIIGSRTPEEREVLFVLLKEGAALPISTIRNYIVRNYASKYREQILKLTYTDLYLLDSEYAGSVPKKAEKEWKRIQVKKFNDEAVETILDLLSKKEKDEADIILSILDDSTIRHAGLKPIPFFRKVAVWDKALQKIGASAPSRKAVVTAVRNLDGVELDKNSKPLFEGIGLLSKRLLEGTKGDWAYSVPSHIRELWEQKRQQVQERIMKGYTPTDSDRELYS